MSRLAPYCDWQPVQLHEAVADSAIDYGNARLVRDIQCSVVNVAMKYLQTRSTVEGARDRVPFIS